MQSLVKSISVIFIPIIISFLGALFFFIVTPQFIPLGYAKSKLIPLAILTIVIPITYSLLQKLLNIEKRQSKIFSIFLNCLLYIIIIQHITPYGEINEVYFYFQGFFILNLAYLILSLLSFKFCLYSAATCYVLIFIVGLSVYYKLNLNVYIAILMVLLGGIMSSRLLFEEPYKSVLWGSALGLLVPLYFMCFGL